MGLQANKDTFEYMEEATSMDEDRARALEIYCKDIASWPDNDKDFQELLEEFNDCYHGYYGGSMKDPEIEYAYQYLEETGLL